MFGQTDFAFRWTRSGICQVPLVNSFYEILCRRQTASSRNRTVSGGKAQRLARTFNNLQW